MILGTVGGVTHGVLLPLLILVFGGVINTFTQRTTQLCSANFTALSIENCNGSYDLTIANYFEALSSP
jgi:hypothetical protein